MGDDTGCAISEREFASLLDDPTAHRKIMRALRSWGLWMDRADPASIVRVHADVQADPSRQHG